MASKVHRIRFYNPKPQPINCASLNKTSKHLAFARGDASIEIWDLNYAPYLLKYIPGTENGSVEALGWVNDRLLSTGLGGALIEWDLDRLCMKTTVLLTGYAAWCLDVNHDNTVAAVGTEQGYVNLYNVENNDIIYQKLFDKQEGRILCCKFSKDGKTIVTGSVNTIRIWNAQTGHAINRMSVTRRDKEVIVWSLALLSDNTIVSGDSLGRLIFWDGDLGEQVQSYSTHKADLLAIGVRDDENEIYCSGVDPVIISFIKVSKKSAKTDEKQWVQNIQRNIHQHDVRGLVLCDDKLISVGIDGYLTFSSYPPKWVMRVPPMIPAARSSLCSKKKLLLLRYSNHLEVWKLGLYASTDNGNVFVANNNFTRGVTNKKKNKKNAIEEDATLDVISRVSNQYSQNQTLSLTEKPVKLVSVQTKGKQQIRWCELSPCGELIVYCTATDVRMLKLENDEEQNNISVSRVLISGVKPAGFDRVAFTDDSSLMVMHCAGSLTVLQVDPDAGATVTQTISLDKQFKTKSILHLYISNPCVSSATYLVVADTQAAISIWTRNAKKFEFYVTLPTYQCVPSAMTVDNQERLIITYVDQKIVQYELANKKFTEWPGSALPDAWVSRKSAVASVSAHPARDALVFQDDTSLWVMEKTPQDVSEPVTKRKSMAEKGNLELRVIPIKYLADFHWLDRDEAVTVEVLPKNIVSQLPAILPGKCHEGA